MPSNQDQSVYNKNNFLIECFTSNKPSAQKLIDQKQKVNINITDEDGNTPLHLALRCGNITVVKLLIKRGADVNARGIYGNTPLHEGIRSNDTFLVKALLNNGADVNASDGFGYTALHEVARLGHISIGELLLDSGADMSVQSITGDTPLHLAVLSGELSMIELLLNENTDINARDRYGIMPLHVAVRCKQTHAVQLLLNKGADVNLRLSKGDTALHLAASLKETSIAELLLKNKNMNDAVGITILHKVVRSGDKTILEQLLSTNVNINVQNKKGEMLLHIAVRLKLLLIADLLLNKGAKVNARNKNNICTSLHIAAKCVDTIMVQLLLDKGANVNARDRNGYTPLHSAIASGSDSIALPELLLNQGANINARDYDKDTPLHIAMLFRYESIKLAELLLNKGADINAPNKFGFTPLHLAIYYQKMSTVKLLLERDVDANVENQYGDTPLHLAVCLGKVCLVKMLLNKEPDVNMQNKRGDTPLHLAVRLGKACIVKLLLNKGVDLNKLTRNRNTPLHVAVRSRMPSIVELLLNKNADLDARNNYGFTPLHLALIYLDVSIAQLLLDKTSNINIPDNYGETPLHLALTRSESIAMLIIDKGAELNAPDRFGNTPLHTTLMHNLTSIAKLLINKGADIHKQTKVGSTPLHLAAYSGMTSVVNLLLNKGAKTNVRRVDGCTPLHMAASFSTEMISLLRKQIYHEKSTSVDIFYHIKDKSAHTAAFLRKTYITELLLKQNADVSAKNINGDTPFHLVAKYKFFINLQFPNGKLLYDVIHLDQRSVLELLLRNGSKINEKNANGDTPLHGAARFSERGIIELLLNEGADVNAQNANGETPMHEALRFGNDVVSLLLNNGADVMLRNKTGDTPLGYALLYSLTDNNENASLLQTAEKKTNSYNLVLKKQIRKLKQTRTKPKIHCDIFKNYWQDIILNINMKNNAKFDYLRTNDNCGMPGQLYETKLLSLIFVRILNHPLVEHDIFLGANIDKIGAMDDVCLRYRVRGTQRPIVMFMQAKHKEHSNSNTVTNKDLWNSGNFSLKKYFRSYLMIRECFKVGNNDPLFEGNFSDIDCYFVLYTSGKEGITKKSRNKENKILHDIINTTQNTEPFQYNHDETDIDCLAEMAADHDLHPMEYARNLVKDFFCRLWFYTSQAKEDDVERILKGEINKNYNNNKEGTKYYTFQFHSDAIFLRAHDEIHRWWKKAGDAPTYLSRSEDFFRFAKLACLEDLMLTVFNSIYHLKTSVDLEFKQCILNYDSSIKIPGMFNTLLSKLLIIISTKNSIIILDNNLKNKIVNLLFTGDKLACKYISPDIDLTQIKDLYNSQQLEHSKRFGTSEDSGVLFKMKMLCLVLLRALNYKQEFLLATKINGIRAMNDICLRYQVKGQKKPVVLFMQLIHREDPENRKLTDEILWSDCEDFYLLKYLKSYLMIRQRFQGNNKNSMFEGEFLDIDSYFIVYTSAKESISKKRNDKRMTNIVKDLLNTEQAPEPFQYDYDKADINRLAKALVKDQIKKLGTIFLQSVMREKYKSLLFDRLIATYHVAMAQEVLQQCEVQLTNIDYRLWQFRPEFFNSDLELFVALKETFVNNLLPKGCQNYQNVVNVLKKLESLKIKLPLSFGNLDMTFRGSKTKVEKRIKAVADKLMYLLKINKDTLIIEINDDDVGPGKTLDQGIVDVNGGIGGAVGNLLIFDTDTSMLKFNLENDVLPHYASLFLKELKADRYKPYNENLSSYRIKIYTSGFLKHSLNDYDYDKKQVKEFFDKFWISPGQAKEDKVERMLRNEMNKKYSIHDIYYNVTDIISLQSLDLIQKWWLRTTDSPYLSRACKLFEYVELAEMFNLLQTVVNYMYIANVWSIDIKINELESNEKIKQMYQVFQDLSAKLFALLDPQFNERLDLRLFNIENYLGTSNLSLRIHPEMEWVSLTMISNFADVNYSVVAKVNLRNEYSLTKNRFMLSEIYSRGIIKTSRDCFNNVSVTPTVSGSYLF